MTNLLRKLCLFVALFASGNALYGAFPLGALGTDDPLRPQMLSYYRALVKSAKEALASERKGEFQHAWLYEVVVTTPTPAVPETTHRVHALDAWTETVEAFLSHFLPNFLKSADVNAMKYVLRLHRDYWYWENNDLTREWIVKHLATENSLFRMLDQELFQEAYKTYTTWTLKTDVNPFDVRRTFSSIIGGDSEMSDFIVLLISAVQQTHQRLGVSQEALLEGWAKYELRNGANPWLLETLVVHMKGAIQSGDAASREFVSALRVLTEWAERPLEGNRAAWEIELGKTAEEAANTIFLHRQGWTSIEALDEGKLGAMYELRDKTEADPWTQRMANFAIDGLFSHFSTGKILVRGDSSSEIRCFLEIIHASKKN